MKHSVIAKLGGFVLLCTKWSHLWSSIIFGMLICLHNFKKSYHIISIKIERLSKFTKTVYIHIHTERERDWERERWAEGKSDKVDIEYKNYFYVALSDWGKMCIGKTGNFKKRTWDTLQFSNLFWDLIHP
jgi:hypothetical protein